MFCFVRVLKKSQDVIFSTKYFGYAQLYGFGHQECIQFHQFQFGHRQLTLFGYQQFWIFTIQIKFGASNLVAPSISKQNNDS